MEEIESMLSDMYRYLFWGKRVHSSQRFFLKDSWQKNEKEKLTSIGVERLQSLIAEVINL